MAELEIDDSDYYSEPDIELEELEELEAGERREVKEEFEIDEEEDLEDILVYEEEPELANEEVISEKELQKKKYARGIASYKEALMRKYAEGQIDDTQYFKELLELEIFENSQIKSMPVTEEGIEFINELRSSRLVQKQKFIKGEINEQEYNTFYID